MTQPPRSPAPLPCPFCDQGAVFKWDDSGLSHGWFIGCPAELSRKGDGSDGPYTCEVHPYIWRATKEEGTAAWNRRAAASGGERDNA
jgi:hypothetical protein